MQSVYARSWIKEENGENENFARDFRNFFFEKSFLETCYEWEISLEFEKIFSENKYFWNVINRGRNVCF